ncbi:MAG: hypothetical protein K2L96_05030 [Muribaculaceae bacterium]|nr:hypothetical protein [Muribaculaceae bacterium]
MNALETYRKIYEASYKRQRAMRTQWYFERLLRSDDEVRVSSDGRAGMIARSYPFLFWGRELPLVNISRATTMPGERGKGCMTELLQDVLREEAMRGVAFAAVNPPTRRLYFFFDKFGFSTVGYYAEERYTAGYLFSAPEGVVGCEPNPSILADIARGRDMSILLSDHDFELLCEQIGMADGSVIAAGDDAGKAIMFAGRHPEPGEPLTVHGLYSSSPGCTTGIMEALRTEAGAEYSLTVRTDAEGAPKARLRSGTMMRILDASTVLNALAEAHPSLRIRIRLHDPLIDANNATFLLAAGHAVRDNSPVRPDLDVITSTLCAILFSEPRIGDIFELPSRRLAPIVLPG